MRSSQEMLFEILQMAQEDVRIRAVIMNGSRVNPNVPPDCFQDFDIVYFVTEVSPFVVDRSWIGRFGELMIMQTPEAMGDPPAAGDGRFVYLMQFMDGNRIDLTFYPTFKLADFERDSLTVVLLDKDAIIDPYAPSNDGDYITKSPSRQQFDDCCNEFWWLCPYVAKGLWRDELSYVKIMFDYYLRDMLLKMIRWFIGVQTGFSVSPGKCGKYFRNYLDPAIWDQFVRTYADADFQHIWEALFVACDLFREAARSVADHFGYQYPFEDDARVSAHLKHVRNLVPDASEIY